LEEAQERYPKAKEVPYSTKPFRTGNESLADLSGLPECPPGWFDSANAGERWEDDY